MSTHDPESGAETSRTFSTRGRVAGLFAVPAIVAGAAADPLGVVAQEAAERGGPGTEDVGLPYVRPSSGITIRDNGQADPYPSNLSVTGLKGFVTDVNLILLGLRHDRPEDVAIELAHLGRGSIVMRGAGGESAVQNANILLDDEAVDPLPLDEPIQGGTPYQPANYRPDAPAFGNGAPGASPGSPALSVFDGLSPNGTWSLFVRDDAPPVSGVLGGWRLVITTDDPSGDFIVVDKYRVKADRKLSVSKSNGLLAVETPGISGAYQVKLSEPPTKGKVNLKSDGSFTYTPRRRKGRDFFTYRFIDIYGGSVSGEGRVEIEITPERRRRRK